MNRQSLKIELFCTHPLSQISAPTSVAVRCPAKTRRWRRGKGTAINRHDDMRHFATIFLTYYDWEPSDELQESLGPSGPEIQQSLERTFSRLFQTFSRLFRDFFEIFPAPRPEAPGDFFRLFWILARRT